MSQVRTVVIELIELATITWNRDQYIGMKIFKAELRIAVGGFLVFLAGVFDWQRLGLQRLPNLRCLKDAEQLLESDTDRKQLSITADRTIKFDANWQAIFRHSGR